MILLVITSNNISLSLQIAFIYYFIPNNLFFDTLICYYYYHLTIILISTY